jgi:hypothetical protein
MCHASGGTKHSFRWGGLDSNRLPQRFIAPRPKGVSYEGQHLFLTGVKGGATSILADDGPKDPLKGATTQIHHAVTPYSWIIRSSTR